MGLTSFHLFLTPMMSDSDDIESPCIRVCNVSGGRCQNCGRTMQQITQWSYMQADEREEVMQQLRDAGYPKPDV